MSEKETKKELLPVSEETDIEATNNQQTETKASMDEEKQTTNQSKGVLFYLLFVLLLIALVGLVYLWDESTQQQQTLKNLLASQQQQKTQQLEQYNKLQQTLSQQSQKTEDLDILKQKLLELGSQTFTLQTQLNLTQQKLTEEKGGVDRDLLLSEADFLIRTAAIRLLLTENASQSISLLEAADQRLLRINDVAIIVVREALAEDIYKLKASEQRDVSGSYLKLEVIGEALSKLRINYILPEQQLQPKQNTELNQDWKDHVAASSERVITKWFQVTQHSEPVKPLLSPDQRSAIKQGFALMIKQAQWALIQKDANLYQNVLSRLQKEIAANFEAVDKNTEIAQQQIKELITESMVAPLPKFLAAEKSIKDYFLMDHGVGEEE